ncbi:MAG: PhzF family phenazine biosynthesis protein [Sedimentisphaerales bacterium]|jgi:trans-2,3-dihydro-3-hydroxyanthranilate isomerase|nr:PhzF family phenazine biosynthesis protein [Sedimentisphaerales bacterium]HNY79910.1 PhzF family phenazine biosynthesis protein [Sedimentisphaerales bacterium]HOC65009.1 PhzF family phenazine biosynthesis protein [Sedimentisphaerales bacterium]HOH63282.1 PhzF family phenazine biosynthesis protein [Sedimentisphaerales bacterium]HPY49276.1 PhzF family phenazine biosynthesis protein [Sedimentisphaerales bacterium]
MTEHLFYIVDVFAERKYAGNQLAVFRNAGDLTDDEMQQIAREMNFSETTFILSDEPRDGGYDVRIFTPVAEVPFAGHPTLGTAYIIRHEIIGKNAEQVNLNLKLKRIPVTFGQEEGRSMLWMKQKSPDFGDTTDPASMVELLGLAVEQIDTRFPIQAVSTGLWFAIVPLKDLEAVKQARVSRDRYFAESRQKHEDGILVFCPETYDRRNDLNVRVFVPFYGIEEDPATGSGNGCLAGYLVKHRYWGDTKIDARVEQGYEIDRPSLIRLKAERQQGAIDVHVGGNVVMVAKGQWL